MKKQNKYHQGGGGKANNYNKIWAALREYVKVP